MAQREKKTFANTDCDTLTFKDLSSVLFQEIFMRFSHKF